MNKRSKHKKELKDAYELAIIAALALAVELDEDALMVAADAICAAWRKAGML